MVWRYPELVYQEEATGLFDLPGRLSAKDPFMNVGTPHWNGLELSSEIETRLGNLRIAFGLPRRVEGGVFDSLLIATLLPAMAFAETLKVPGAVSGKLLAALPQVQDIFTTWDRHYWKPRYPKRPRLERITVQAEERQPRPPRTGVAAFFSAGVDSFYTALKHADEIDAFVYIHGFDVEPDRPDVRENVMEGVRSSAAALGKVLVELEADFRPISPNFVSWGAYHGAALASVAALLSEEFGKIYVPSSYSYPYLRPWGSHPLLDPLWSTDEIEIIHDGCEATKTQKVQAIAGNEAAQRWLRVCMENPDGAYNCSSCHKCLWTMVSLRGIGALESFSSFPPLDVADMRFAFDPRVPEDSWRRLWGEILSSVKESGQDPGLQQGIERLLGSGAP